MSYLLDTNVLSELRKGARANAGVKDWVASVDEASLFTSVLVSRNVRDFERTGASVFKPFRR